MGGGGGQTSCRNRASRDRAAVRVQERKTLEKKPGGGGKLDGKGGATGGNYKRGGG